VRSPKKSRAPDDLGASHCGSLVPSRTAREHVYPDSPPAELRSHAAAAAPIPPVRFECRLAPVGSPRARPTRGSSAVIDRLRKQIQERLAEVMAEAEKLRQALAELDDRGVTGSTKRARSPRRGASGRSRTQPRPRTPPGATRARVLDALSAGNAMTASEVASATGLGSATVSTTLSKLAKSGDVRKAERGYSLPKSRRRTASAKGP
jgi:DNA-binding transcriptional ArsR family regulator